MTATAYFIGGDTFAKYLWQKLIVSVILVVALDVIVLKYNSRFVADTYTICVFLCFFIQMHLSERDIDLICSLKKILILMPLRFIYLPNDLLIIFSSFHELILRSV